VNCVGVAAGGGVAAEDIDGVVVAGEAAGDEVVSEAPVSEGLAPAG